MPDDASTRTLHEAADALRYWLTRFDRDRVGLTAACHIDLAIHLLDEEARMLRRYHSSPPPSHR